MTLRWPVRGDEAAYGDPYRPSRPRAATTHPGVLADGEGKAHDHARQRLAYEKSTKGLVAVWTTAFAGVLLATVAIFRILQGIAALASNT